MKKPKRELTCQYSKCPHPEFTAVRYDAKYCSVTCRVMANLEKKFKNGGEIQVVDAKRETRRNCLTTLQNGKLYIITTPEGTDIGTYFERKKLFRNGTVDLDYVDTFCPPAHIRLVTWTPKK